MFDVGETRLMSTEVENGCNEAQLSELIRGSFDNKDYYLCDNCHYDSETVVHGNCKEIIVFPSGYQEYIACKCECNRDSWESEQSIKDLEEEERLANSS